MGSDAEQRLRERGRRDDDVEAIGLEGKTLHGRPDLQLLGLHSFVPGRFRAEEPRPANVAADGGDARPARAGDVEGALERPLDGRLVERAHDRDRAAGGIRDAVDAGMQVELGLDPRESRCMCCCDEDRLRLERRLSRRLRQGVSGLREGLAREGRVRLLDPEAVQARDARERTARLRHHLRADAVPGETDDGVRPVAREGAHAATSLACGSVAWGKPGFPHEPPAR